MSDEMDTNFSSAMTHVYHRSPAADYERSRLEAGEDQATYMRKVRLRNHQMLAAMIGYRYY